MKTIIVSGYAYPFIEQWVLEAWLRDLTILGNFSYGITPAGGIIDLNDQNLTATANSAGVKPLMVLTPLNESGIFNSVTATALLANPTARANLSANILETVRRKGLAGVDFDFEYIPAENKEDYVALVRETRDLLAPEGYLVTVALAPKTSADQPGVLYGGHDYKGMGEASDFVLVMTYEWGYTSRHQ